MLGGHPEIHALPETCIFARETIADLLRDRGSALFDYGLVRAVAQLVFDSGEPAALDLARRWLIDRRHRSTSSVFADLRRRVSQSVIVEKSPIFTARSEHLERIERTFSDVFYLHLVRAPHGFGRSLLRTLSDLEATVPPAYVERVLADPDSIFCGLAAAPKAPRDPQHVWLARHRRIQSFLAGIDSRRHRTVRSEDCLNAPESALRDICSWLELDFNDRILQRMVRTGDWLYARAPTGTHGGGDRRFFQSPELKARPREPVPLSDPLPWPQVLPDLRSEVYALASAYGYR
jgi:hypothetical protein